MRTRRWVNVGVAMTLIVSVGCAGTTGPPPDAAQPDTADRDPVDPEAEAVQEVDDGPSEPSADTEGEQNAAASGTVGVVDGVEVDDPAFDHAVTTRDSEDGSTRLILIAVTPEDTPDDVQVDLAGSARVCAVPDGQSWQTWHDAEDDDYPCFTDWEPSQGDRDIRAADGPLEMELDPGRYRVSYFVDSSSELLPAPSPPFVDLEEGETAEFAFALQPRSTPRPGTTYRFSLTTDEAWVYRVNVTVPSATGVEAEIYDSPPGRAELIAIATPPYGYVSGATPGRNPPPQTARVRVTFDLDLDVTETGCLPGICDRDGRLSLYEPQPGDELVCSYDRPRLTCELPGMTMQNSAEVGFEGDHQPVQVIGEGDEDVLFELLVDQFMWAEATTELLFDGAGGPDGECTVQLRPDRTVALTDGSTCSVGPPV